MAGVAVVELIAYALAIGVVLWVNVRAARTIRRASAPSPGSPTGSELGHELLEEHGLGVVEIREGDVDAYHAIGRVIKLADGRFDHGSPAAWAVVALEVAHARQHESGSAAWRRWWVVSGHTVWAARAYMAESVFDLGLLDRAAEPYRGDARVGGSG